MPINKQQAKTKITELIQNYRKVEQPEQQSEANVRANFVDPLFEALGWPTRNPTFYNREQYVRGTGFADIALKIDEDTEDPLIFVEAKRFGALKPLTYLQDNRNRDMALQRLQIPGMSVDRTREEQQAINYAYRKGMRWAILTNFEHFRLFNARRDTLVLGFDTPDELLERFDELWQIAFDEVQQGSLEGLRGHRERLDIDEEYLHLINEWRLRLGQDIIAHPENLSLLKNPETQEIDVYKLRDAVQRILDRLVVIRYAEDRLVIKVDQLQTMVELQDRTDYSMPLLEQIRYFFEQFNVRHNGALFLNHTCDHLKISEDVLKAIILNLYDARFRAMSADIMGNTYEQYLGQTLAIINDEVHTVDNLETRKAQGSYYTPEYVVRYIVDHTLGRYLYGTHNGRADGEPVPGMMQKRLEDIDGSNGQAPLRVLDPACGSGSFLMYAYHVLEKFYSAEIKRIERERDHKFEKSVEQNLSPFDIQVELAGYKQRLADLKDYKNQILERHLYGVDLDPQAAELAAVNLMLRAMTRGRRLPLILNQNIKVGNSLLGGTSLERETSIRAYEPHYEQLAELRRLRLSQQGVTQEIRRPGELQEQFEDLANQINSNLNENLSLYFENALSVRRPFNWITEFPEVFVDDEGILLEEGGFTIVLGNPPYLSVDDTWGSNSVDAAYLRGAFPEIWAGKSDIYYYFIHQGLSLLTPGGILGFITARYYLEAYYAKNLREVLLRNSVIRQVVDFGDFTVFPRVGTKTSITLLQREGNEQERSENKLVFDRVKHKRIDVLSFLKTYQETAQPFPQSELDGDSWNLYGKSVAKIIEKIDKDSQPLGELTFIGKGMETGRNAIFVVNESTLGPYQIEPELVRKNIKNQDITRYNLGFRGLFLIYPEDIESLDAFPHTKDYLEEHRETLEERAAFQRGDCEWWRFTWPLHKERYDTPKIITPYIAPKNRFALDATTEFIGLTDTTVIFSTDESPDLRYLLALLNSQLLSFRYRYIGKAKDYRYEYFENGLKKIPIRLAQREVAQELITLAQRMLDLSAVRQLVIDEFIETLDATIHSTHDFYGAYYTHSEYKEDSIRRSSSANANNKGTVTSINIYEKGKELVLHVTEDGVGDLSLITLEIPDDDFRRFLLLGIRADLLANQRKKIWSRERMLSGVLKAITVPVLYEATAAGNFERVQQMMTAVRQRVRDKVDVALGDRVLQVDDILDLGDIESLLADTDERIDELVFQLYEVESRDELEVIREFLS